MKKRLITAIAAFTFTCSTHASDELPKALEEKLLATGVTLIEQIKWPDPTQIFGYKTLVIGNTFNLKDPLVRAYVKERDNFPENSEPFMCQYLQLSPFIECRVTLWNDSKDFSKELQDLQSAFGEPVQTSFILLLSNAPTLADLNKNNFSASRIIAINIENSRPSSDFVIKSSNYFSSKVGSQPIVRTSYLHPENLYSKDCILAINRINAKPIAQLSTQDNADRERCDTQAKIAILSGKVLSGSTTERKWSAFGGKYFVTISTTETYMSLDSGTTIPVTSKAEISIELNSTKATEAWQNEMGSVKRLWKIAQQSEAKSDF